MSASSRSIPKSILSDVALSEHGEAQLALRLLENVADGRGVPPAEVTCAVRTAAPGIIDLPPAVLRASIEAALLGRAVGEALEWLRESGLLAQVLPELEATVNFSQELGRRHKDLWEHTKQVVAQSAPILAVRWAALLHDMGKVPTRALTADGKVTFHGHAEVGARMFDPIARRLDFPTALRARVRWLILHHQRISQYDSSWTDSAVRRFYRSMEAHLDDLLLLSRADVTSARPEKRAQVAAMLEDLVQRVVRLRELDATEPPLPPGLGDALMERFALSAGRWIGDLKRRLEQAIERGELAPHQPSDVYLAHIEQAGWLPLVLADQARAGQE